VSSFRQHSGKPRLHRRRGAERPLSCWVGGEDDDVRSERMSELHAHVTKPAECNHANFLPVGDAPAVHR
ncbi:MAG: hypothetical protein QOJ99_5800, partial [Bryobacterales bacterium]|nr:hypothetical protein [Bryobacterales bacterium]